MGPHPCHRYGLDRHGDQDFQTYQQNLQQSPSYIVTVLVEMVVQYFVDKPQSEKILVVAATPVHFGTEKLFFKFSTLVPHFLVLHFLVRAGHQRPC
jgi:hypothetical protein